MKKEVEVYLWSLVSLLLAFMVFYLLFSFGKLIFYYEVGREIKNYYDNVCQSAEIFYSYEVFVPDFKVYSKILAKSLLEICTAVSFGNCQKYQGGIPLPPGFTNSLKINDQDYYGYIFWNQDSACFAFSGTMTESEWWYDVQYSQVTPSLLNNLKEGILVHSGFYSIYSKIRSNLWDFWNSNKKKNLFITGASLGAAISVLAAFDFSGNNVIHYSFAAPRVGNVVFAQTFDNILPYSVRINNTEDIVPQLPLAVMPQNFGKTVYYYEQTENNVPFTVNLGSVVSNHTTAYRDYLPQDRILKKDKR